jgi:hypothetical protein
VEFGTAVTCSKCKQPIVSGEGFGFVCFKIPGTDGYHFFHRRSRSEDCWEGYLREPDNVVHTRKLEVDRWAQSQRT